jgi:hypothetical protein
VAHNKTRFYDRNNGMLECWNIVSRRRTYIKNGAYKMSATVFHASQYFSIPLFQLFHYSTIPIFQVYYAL